MYTLCSRAQVTHTLREAKHWSGPPFAALGANPGAHPRCAVAFWCVLVRRGAPWPPVTPISSAVHGPPHAALPRQYRARCCQQQAPLPGKPPTGAPSASYSGAHCSLSVCGGFFQLSSSRPSKPPTLLVHFRSRSHTLFLPLLIPSHTHSRNARLAFAINPLLLFPHIGVCVSSLLLATINEGFRNGW